ncbi:conserved hypothetical protein [Ricinus communis]|uniref:Uncharacterized protein n=1 Tax=Ricinus communis TaxID=3988 RepID=B9RBR9_RICCO|nr:conserved hypothetical protein [Ricinus communis]
MDYDLKSEYAMSSIFEIRNMFDEFGDMRLMAPWKEKEKCDGVRKSILRLVIAKERKWKSQACGPII